MTGPVRIVRPRAAILIPAYNEAAVIGRTLACLGKDMHPGEFEVIVVANGCTDSTAAQARQAMPEACVLETSTPGKCNALRLGLAHVSAPAVVFLDADLDIDAASIRRLIAPLLSGSALASHGRMIVDLAGCDTLVRAFYAIWSRSAYLRGGKFGGAFALSARALPRIQPLPDLIADDEFISRSFLPAEKCFVRDVAFTARAPRTLRDLVKIRKRSLRGTRELNALGCVPPDQCGRHGRVKLVIDAALTPRLWPALSVFLSVMAAVRLGLAVDSKNRGQTWERDDSSRVAQPQ